MHPATDRFPPGREGVERLFEALAAIPEDALLFLARSYRRDEQTARDAAWEQVLEEAAFRHRDGAIDEIRAAAIDQVAIRHSAGDLRYASAPFGAGGGAMHDPVTQARVVNAMIEAGGAILVADLLATHEEERAAAEAETERRRRDPYELAGD